MIKIKERIENNLVVFFLSTLVAGFLGGIGTYGAVIEIAKLKVISSVEYDSLRKQGHTPKDLPEDTSPEALEALSTEAEAVAKEFLIYMQEFSEYNRRTKGRTATIEVYVDWCSIYRRGYHSLGGSYPLFLATAKHLASLGHDMPPPQLTREVFKVTMKRAVQSEQISRADAERLTGY